MARRLFLIVYGLSGAAALLYQLAWSRLLTLHMGHTVAAVGTVLAAFMGGLAVGAAVAGRFAPLLSRQRALVWYEVRRPALWLASTLVLAALAAAGASLALGQVPLAVAGIVSAPTATLSSVVAREALLIAPLLLPMTIAFGAAFPFAVAVAARHPDQAYDVIISEASNPWMAGIAALFTREFFAAARSRLRPDGVLCQWAHTYDISDADLRSLARVLGARAHVAIARHHREACIRYGCDVA